MVRYICNFFFLVHHADLLWVVSNEFWVFTTEWHGVSRSFLFSFGRRDERTRWNSAYSLVDVMVSWTTLQRYRYEKRGSSIPGYIFNCFHSWSWFFKTCWLLGGIVKTIAPALVFLSSFQPFSCLKWLEKGWENFYYIIYNKLFILVYFFAFSSFNLIERLKGWKVSTPSSLWT